MKKNLFLTFLACMTLICNSTISQTINCTQVYVTTADLMVNYLNNGDPTSSENKIDFEYIQANIGTWSGIPGLMRSFLKFDLPELATSGQASIQNVILNLYNPFSPSYVLGHHSHGTNTPNRITFNRVTEPWGKYTITWNNQPAVDMTKGIISQQFTGNSQVSGFEDVHINLNDILLNNGILFSDFEGISFRCTDENINDRYRFVNFATTRHPNSAYWPTLEVEYELPSPNISYDGYRTFQAVNIQSIESVFSNIFYRWNINGKVSYGKTATADLGENNTIELEVVLTNSVGNSYVCVISATINYGSSTNNVLNNIVLQNAEMDLYPIDFTSAANNEYGIYPNPGTDYIEITGNSNKKVVQYRIINSTGLTVKEGIYENGINVSALNAGVYYIRLTNTSNENHVLSFIKR